MTRATASSTRKRIRVLNLSRKFRRLLIHEQGLSHQERVLLYILQRHPGASDHSVKRVFRHPEGDVDLVSETLVKASQQSAAACKEQALVDDVSVQFWWRLLEYLKDRCLYICKSLFKSVGDLLV